MAIKLSVATEEAESAPPSGCTAEHLFDKDAIAIGRKKTSDVVLESPKVSGSHARIEKRGEAYWLVDLQSTNGTSLQGKKLAPGSPVEVQSGDTVQIDGFLLSVEILPPDDLERTIAGGGPAAAGEARPAPSAARLSEALLLQYALSASAPPDERGAALRAALRSALGTASPEERRAACREALEAIEPGAASEARAPAPADAAPGKAVLGKGLPGIVAVPAEDGFQKQEALYRAGQQALSELARHFLGQASFASAEDIARFSSLLRQTLEVTLNWIDVTLKGRKEFEGQMGVELSKLFTREKNPIKAAGTPQAMGAYLLDFHADRRQEGGKVALEEAFQDLTMHQLGLLRGLQECVQTILRQLHPDEVERAALARAGWLSRLVYKLPSARARGAWRQYRRLYEEAMDGNNVFLGLFPILKEGYVKYHQEALGKSEGAEATAS